MTITPLKMAAIGLLLLLSKAIFGQAPNLGTAANFAFFTSIGAFDNAGATYITGDIGTNSGALTGFPPGTLVGQAHVANATSAQAALDVDAAYNYLTGLTCGTTIGIALGNNQTLTAKGKVVSRGQYSANNTLNISQLPAGFYVLHIQSLALRFFKN
jgi:hypothetical protein